MRLTTTTIAFILIAALGCGRSAPEPKIEFTGIPLPPNPVDSPELFARIMKQAEEHIQQKEFDEAEHSLDAAFNVAIRLTPGDSKDAANVLDTLAILEMARKRFDEADSFLVKAGEMYTKVYGSDHSLIVNVLNNRAVIARTVKDTKKAEQFERDAKEMAARLRAKMK